MDFSLPDSRSLHAVDNKIKSLEESTQALKIYRNTLVPISRLPTEILTIIFSLLASLGVLESSLPIAPSPVSHVCHRWRDISLNLPYLWNHINFTTLTSAGAAEMLARSKTVPLHLEAWTTLWSIAELEAFEMQIGAHIYHTRHLSVTATGEHLVRTFGQLVSSAPSLEQFSIANLGLSRETLPLVIPDTLFHGIAPKLIHLCLNNCGIRWESPLLKNLRDLELISFPSRALTTLNTWLDALNQMPQLERLSLQDGIPTYSTFLLPSAEPERAIFLSSLTELDISASARDCRVVLSHLILPALTRLCVNAQIDYPTDRDLQHLIPYIVQNAHGPHDTKALQSLFIGGNKRQTEFVAWTMPRQDTDDRLRYSVDLPDGIRLARVAFSILTRNRRPGMDITLYDALLTALPLNSITSLTIRGKGRTPLSWQVWHSHAPRWHKLKRVCLSSSAVPALRGMLEDAPSGGSLLPSLEELVLVDVSLNAQKVYYLYSMLIELVELDTPLWKLNLQTCTAADRAVQLLSEIVVDVQGPVKRESGARDLDGKGRGSIGAVGEEGGRDEDEGGFDDVPSFLGSWDTDDDDDDDDDYYDVDDGDEEEASSTGSEFVE
jgi:hypothetical protein